MGPTSSKLGWASGAAAASLSQPPVTPSRSPSTCYEEEQINMFFYSKRHVGRGRRCFTHGPQAEEEKNYKAATAEIRIGTRLQPQR